MNEKTIELLSTNGKDIITTTAYRNYNTRRNNYDYDTFVFVDGVWKLVVYNQTMGYWQLLEEQQ